MYSVLGDHADSGNVHGMLWHDGGDLHNVYVQRELLRLRQQLHQWLRSHMQRHEWKPVRRVVFGLLYGSGERVHVWYMCARLPQLRRQHTDVCCVLGGGSE